MVNGLHFYRRAIGLGLGSEFVEEVDLGELWADVGGVTIAVGTADAAPHRQCRALGDLYEALDWRPCHQGSLKSSRLECEVWISLESFKTAR
jgi:hypothetical protein